jgi:hypothetical protein
MTAIPNYHTQPATLDPSKPLPEDPELVPLAQGHDADRRDAVIDAQAAHREQAESEPDEPVGAGDPTKPQGKREADDAPDDSCPPSGTIEEIKAWVGDDHDRAQQALTAERNGQQRQTLIAWLESV